MVLEKTIQSPLGSLSSQVHRDRSKRCWGPRDWEERENWCFLGTRVSVWEDEKVLEMMVGMVAQPCQCAMLVNCGVGEDS